MPALIWPDLKDWRTWTALLAAAGTAAVIMPKAEAFYYVSSGYLNSMMVPLLAASYENKIEIIESKQVTLQMTIDNWTARLRTNPDDPLFRKALADAQAAYGAAQYQKDEAYCSLRQAKGLGCAGG